MDGTIDWLCLPAFDSPAVFCSILDDEKGGRFGLSPVDCERSQQLYLPDTNVLLTRFFSSDGMGEVIDFMPILSEPGGRSRVVRQARVVRGSMRFRVECRPSFDYARGAHRVSVVKRGAVFASESSTHASLGLATDVGLEEWAGGAAGAGAPAAKATTSPRRRSSSGRSSSSRRRCRSRPKTCASRRRAGSATS